ncbi:MAG: DUF4328 domain-containing protein [Actinomycetota bacterium]|nr:DUF4328 domain-containing protein [Actinomycetota bacterium]
MTDLPPPPPPNMAPPPGYVAYGGGYTAPQGTLRPVGSLGMWLGWLIIGTLISQALVVVVQFTLRNSARDFLLTGNASAFDDKLGLFFGIGLIAGALAVAQLVVLCVWTWRLAKNAQILGRQPQKFSPGATIAINILGGCTLGILPFFMWREVWRASDPDVAPGDVRWKSGLVTTLIPVHLGLTIAAAIITGISSASRTFGVSTGAGFNTGNRTDLAKSLDDKMALIGVGGALSFSAAIVFLLIARQLTARHMRATREA